MEHLQNYQLRHIQPSDVRLVLKLVESLSPGTLYFRFGRMNHPVLSEADVAKICAPDLAFMIGYVAVKNINGAAHLLGLGRIERHREQPHAEFVIVVGDAWQGHGIGKQLMLKLIEEAYAWNVTRLYGETLPSNHGMHAFCERLGFKRCVSTTKPGLIRMQIDF